PRAKRAGTVEAFCSGPLVFGALGVTSRQVIAHRVAKDHFVRAVDGNIFGDATDDDGQFCLVGDLFGPVRQHDRLIGPNNRGVGLKNSSGVVGISLPSSSAWASQFRTTPMTLERGKTGVTRRTSSSFNVSVVGTIPAYSGSLAW